ncbi:MAG TPA: FAD-dependent oxidoreductase [Oceanospirillaceae bacterium]|nr:FAD-dependent oxidoreductase [Oceanospirillaceae bacterium]
MNRDVIIIGGGIHGSAIAYNLARAGVAVVVLERDWVGRHASGVNAGGVRLLGRDPAEVAISKLASQLWQQLDEELDAGTGFRCRSLINIAADEEDLHSLAKRQQLLNNIGHTHEQIIDQQELRQRLPHVAHHCVGGVVCEGDGYAIPCQTTAAFRRAAERHGAQFISPVEVQRIRQLGNCWRVETNKTTFEAQRLVNCAGAWADKIASQIGDNVPLTCSAPMLMITNRMPHFAFPVVGAVSRVLSFKQFENGTVLIGGGAQGFAYRTAKRSTLDYAKMSTGAQNAIEFFPIMQAATINRMWAGLEAYLPDNLPVIGSSPSANNAYHAFGFSAHGFQLAPGVGRVMAELIITGNSEYDLNPFRADRFERKIL